PEARELAASLRGSRYLDVIEARTEKEAKDALVADRQRGYVVVPPDFSQRLHRADDTASVLVVTDGSEPNLANFVETYVQGALQIWQQQRAADLGEADTAPVTIEARFWLNPSADSRNFLIPGSIAVIMTVIGALLTSLVVAREWE